MINTVVAVQHVVVCSATQHIVAGAAKNVVHADAAVEVVGIGTTIERVLVASAKQKVDAGPAFEAVIAIGNITVDRLQRNDYRRHTWCDEPGRIGKFRVVEADGVHKVRRFVDVESGMRLFRKSAPHDIAALISEQTIVAEPANQQIVTIAAAEDIIPVVAVDFVVTAVAKQFIRPGATKNHIGTASAMDGVASTIAMDLVVASTAVDVVFSVNRDSVGVIPDRRIPDRLRFSKTELAARINNVDRQLVHIRVGDRKGEPAITRALRSDLSLQG